ncbi:GNAT family N-acetyltransferase [Zhihengliuella halotolerans]|uniref:Acetyltransferase (GNAT) family protein n=1 Tax=Zhihengliuella halotolerans TaxID=370736 RepID=A0A4Q8A9X9_9MICC|nr:GNAT family N-acetyltransferase [Zhihengliuella halotolerans]RZU60890.1 acetyltransferase (GNAT) family protein [Zhihengliuella halotolerans]
MLSETLTLPDGGMLALRRARADDVSAIVALLADDQLGAARDGVDGPDGAGPYLRAFAEIDADPSHALVVVEDAGAVVATLQLSILPGLARRGAKRGQVEAVRVGRTHRGRGLGTAMLRWVIAEAERRGCALLQLTSDKSRTDAHRFYTGLGFAASHDGFKLIL